MRRAAIAVVACAWAARALAAGTSTAARVAGGDYPLNLLEVGGRYLVSTNDGYGAQYLQSYDEAQRRVTGKLVLPSLWFGLAYDPQGRLLLASDGNRGVYVIPFRAGAFGGARRVEIPGCRFTAGLVVLDRERAAVACNQSHEVVVFHPRDGAVIARAPVGEYPFALAAFPGNRLAVSNWGQASVTVLRAPGLEKLAEIPTGSHPNQMLWLPDARQLAVACSGSDSVSLIGVDAWRETRRLDLRPAGGTLSGVQPNALAWHGHRLFVALAAVEGIAAFRIQREKSLDVRFEGVIPVGPFPTALHYSNAARALFVANGRNAVTGPNAAPPRNGRPFRYIGEILGGGIEMLSEAALAGGPARFETLAQRIYGSAQRAPLPPESLPPIRYVFYVIKENRTYDQVLGDMPEGNGSPELAIFGARVTPNHHALARDYILFDNFYASGDVSADGHLWSTAATSTEYVNKIWPMEYSDRAPGALDAAYDGDARHGRPIAVPDSGFLWDRLLATGISFRNYGEWYAHDEDDAAKFHVYLTGLKHHSDLNYSDAIGAVTDQRRIDEWEREFARFEKDGDLPRFSLIYLPNDHTVGTRAGYPTPTAMMADNDLALGRLVERISRSRFWSQSVILVLEDDAQDGPDHVDAHRSVLLAISPYTRRHAVSHRFYSTASVVKTITRILGIGSLTYFDDRAGSLLGEFTGPPDMQPFGCLPPGVSLDAVNSPGAPGARQSARWDFRGPDRAPWLELNRVIWKSVKGAGAEPPAPVFRVSHPW